MIAGSAAYGRPISVRPTRRPRSGWSVRRTARQEPVDQDFLEQLARQLGLDRAADDLGAPAQHGDRGGVFLQVGEQGFLGRAAGMSQRDALAGVESLHPLGQGRGHGIGQRQVHVVAAQQDVLADGQARQGQVAPFVGHGDQGEVGRAAADVANQDDVADLDLLPPFLALDGQPGVERGLRLLEERDVLQPGLGGRFHGQLARDRVERGRDRQEDFLVLEPVGGGLAGDSRVPGVAQVLEIGRRRGDRRDSRHIVGGRPGQNGRAAVDAGVRKPALGRADQPARHLGSVLAREDAEHAVRRRSSTAGQTPPPGIPWRAGKYKNEGSSGRSRHVVDRDDLRDRQARDRSGLVVIRWRCRRHTPAPSSSFPGRCQPHSETYCVSIVLVGSGLLVDFETQRALAWCISEISTSAGESTEVSSRATGKSGRWTDSDPPAVMLEHALKRGEPLTLPTRRIAAGSKSVGTVTRSSSAALMTGSIVR